MHETARRAGLRSFRAAAVSAPLALFLGGCATGGVPVPHGAGAASVSPIAIVPRPVELRTRPGTLRLTNGARIVVVPAGDARMSRLARTLADELRTRTGLPFTVEAGGEADGMPDTPGIDTGRPSVRLVRTGPRADPGPPFERDESYRMRIDREGVEIRAPEPEGVFYGTRSLLQLLPVRGGATATAGAASPAVALPFLEIADAPRFRYRGLHLDVSRHWFPVEFVKRYVDLMARYKLNVFHWHLTDDQGWRLEIRRYPRLTEVGGRRRETMVGRHFDPYLGDGVPYQGWYTQEEVRDVVAYAAERYVTVIPEIEMPGHSMAVLAAYPELACTPGPFEVATTWGVHEDILCPKEETFTFLQNVLQEVMELFPSPLLHVGGDEAPRARWIESPVAQEVIRTQGLADESELQSWFLRRIERFVGAHGRRVVGWDEILEGGLPPDAVVMSWRGVEGGVEAARQGHDVIMAPTSHVYFDYYQGDPESEPLAIGGYLPLERVYGFEPVPEDLDAAEAAHVLGAQGNVWTEYLATPDAVEYMAFPRALALAEVVWSPRGRRDLPDFLRRLRPRLAELDALGVAYRPLDGPPSPAP